MSIDTTFDFRSDVSGKNTDPDASSPTLLRYHHQLWSKTLPSGRQFDLTPRPSVPYSLEHESDLGRFVLTSDTALPTFTHRPSMQAIMSEVPADYLDALNTVTYTIGAMILWPGNQIDRKWTINQARGCSHAIVDRLDLTVECVRRHYAGDTSHPLGDVFARYASFFELFDDFAGYIDFWLLSDLVDADGRVRFFLPSDDFALPSLPQNVTDYLKFCEHTIDFVTARNRRIQRAAQEIVSPVSSSSPSWS